MCLVGAITIGVSRQERGLNGKISDRCETGCSCFRGDGTARTDHQYTSSFSCLLTCHRVVCNNYVLQGSDGRSNRLDRLLLLYVDFGARKIRMIVQSNGKLEVKWEINNMISQAQHPCSWAFYRYR